MPFSSSPQDPSDYPSDAEAQLQFALQYVDFEKMIEALDAGAGANALLPAGRLPLVRAVRSGSQKMVRALVARGAALNGVQPDGETALAACAFLDEESGLEMAGLLMELGADPGLVTPHKGIAPAVQAADFGRNALLELLLDRGACLNPAKGDTPLLAASRNIGASEDFILSLIDRGADIRARDHMGNSVLGSSCYWGRTKVVAHLLASGASMDNAGGEGRTALHRACEQRSSVMDAGLMEEGLGEGILACAQLLLDAGADPSAVDDNGNTPLHLAAGNGLVEMTRKLLDAGAQIDQAPSEGGGHTPLHEAVYNSATGTMALLMERGADLDVRSKFDLTPQEWVMQHSDQAHVADLIADERVRRQLATLEQHVGMGEGGARHRM